MKTILPNPLQPDCRAMMTTNGSGSKNPHKPYNVRRALRVHACILPSGYMRQVKVSAAI